MDHLRAWTVVVIIGGLTQLSHAEDARSVVVIHGAWGGAHHWKAVDEAISKEGHFVKRVSLTGLGERSHLVSKKIDLQTHIQDAVNAIEFDDLSSVILVAHSYGGVVAQGVVDEIPERIAALVCIDSHLLRDGESYLTNHPDQSEVLTRRASEAGDGWLIPVDWKNTVRDTPHPLATLTQTLELTREVPETIQCHYWLLGDGKPVENDQRFQYYERAQDLGWNTQAFPWNHNPQRQRPDDVARELLRIIEANER